MPIVQPKRSAADDFLDSPDSPQITATVRQVAQGPPAPPSGLTPVSGQVANPQGASVADAFLDAPDSGQAGPLSRFASNAWEKSPPMGIVGMAKGILHPVDTFNADLAARRQIGQEATNEAKQGGILGGATGIVKRIESLAPFIGPALHSLGHQFETGDIAGGIGSALGLASSAFAPEAMGSAPVRGIRSGMQSAADRIYRVGTSPMSPEVARFGTTQGIPLDAAGLKQAGILQDQIGQRIGGPIRAAEQTPSISPGPVVSGLQKLKENYIPQEQPPVDAAQQSFLDQLRSQPGGAVRNMTPAEAFDTKVRYSKAAIRGNKNVFEAAQLGPAGVASRAEISGRLSDQLVSQFPEIAESNAQYGLVSDLMPEIDRMVDQAARRNPIRNLATMSGAVTGIATGHPMTGLFTSAAMEIAANPALRSRFAIMLSKAARVPLPEASARITGYLNAIGQGAGAAEANGPQ